MDELKDFKSGLDAGQKIGNAGSLTRGAVTPKLISTMIKVLMMYLSSSAYTYQPPLHGGTFRPASSVF